MSNRFTLLAMMAATYAGPLLAGWSGLPAPVALGFAVFFFVSTYPTQPWSDLGMGQSLLRGAITIGIQTIVALVVIALGWGLAAGLGSIAVPFWLSLGVTAVGAGALFFRNRQLTLINDVIDQAAEAIERGAIDPDSDIEFMVQPEIPADEAAAEAVAALRALPADAPFSTIEEIAAGLFVDADAAALPHLTHYAGEGEANIDRALAALLSLPDPFELAQDRSELGLALSLLLSSDQAEVIETVDRLLIKAMRRGVWPIDLPDAATMDAAVDRHAMLGPTRDALTNYRETFDYKIAETDEPL